MTTTAALLTALRRRGLSPGRSRVVIAGAATMPVLRPLLLAAGVGCVTSWDRCDAVMFPLRWITRNAEAVVDLLGCSRELAEAASDHPELIIIFPDQTSWTRLALPGLLRAAATAQDPKSGIAGYHACVLALVAATPPDRLLPDSRDPALSSMVDQAVSRATS
jgi:malate dehydrogenase (oxaloacetate-decarboxylating)